MGKWDKGLTFESLKEILNRDLDLAIRIYLNNKRKKRIAKELIYLTVGYIQLHNGARIGETIEGFKEFMKSNKDIVFVKVEKRKDNFMRPIIIPNKIKTIYSLLKEALFYGFNNNLDLITKQKVKDFWSKRGINTHNFRYSFENYLARNKVDVYLVAIFQGRKKLDSRIYYMRQQEAISEIKKLID